MFIVLCVFILGYWIYEAITEWMVWQNVNGGTPIHDGNYHRYRIFEAIAIFGIAVSGCLIRSPVIWDLVGIFGMWVVGWTIYEAILSERSGDGIWNKPTPWKVRIFGRTFKIHFPRWVYVTSFLLGIVILGVAFYFG